MNQVRISFSANYDSILWDIFHNKCPLEGECSTLENGIKATYLGKRSRFRSPQDQIITILLSIPLSIGVNVFSNWIYEKLKTKNVKSIKVENKKIPLEKESIKKEIENKFSSS